MLRPVLLSLFFVWLSGGAFAQTADSITLDPVIVMAGKLPARAKDRAQPLRTIGRAELDRAAGQSLTQVLQNQLGLIVNGAYSNPGQNQSVYLRGANNGYALLLLDGVPLRDVSGVNGNFDIRLLSVDQIERIEILPGSQSTLHGSDAVAGVINIISRQQRTEGTSVQLKAAYGSLETIDLGAAIRGRSGDISYALQHDRMRTDGLSEALPPPDSTDYDTDGFTRQSTRGSIGYTRDRVRLVFSGRYSKQEGRFDDGAFLDGDNSYETDYVQGGLQSRWLFNNLRLHVNYQYLKTESEFITAFGPSPFNGQTHQADVFANLNLGSRATAVVGLYAQEAYTFLTDAMDAEERFATNTYAPYIHIDGAWGSKWQWAAGVRADIHSNFGTEPTYSFSLARDLAPAWRTHLAYGTGFKAPTLLELFGPFGSNPELDPQRSSTLEWGLAYRPTDRIWRADLSIFRRNIQDVIVFASFPFGYFNQDEQKDVGVELQTQWHIGGEWRAELGYTYLNGEVSTVTDTDRDTSFFNLLRRPQHNVQAGLRWHIFPSWQVAVRGQYLSQRDDLFFNPVTFSADPVELDPYVLVNFYTDWRLAKGQGRVFLDIKNLLNTDFTEVYGFSTLGRNVRFGIVWQWQKNKGE